MVKWSAVHWLLVVFCVITYLHSGEVKSELFCCHVMCLQMHSSLRLSSMKDTKICGFLCSPPTISLSSIRGMNQNINFSCIFQPKVQIGAYSCYIHLFSSGFHHVKWRAVRLKWFILLCCAEGTEIAFQVYLLLEYVGGPEKDQVLLQARKSLSPLSVYSSC